VREKQAQARAGMSAPRRHAAVCARGRMSRDECARPHHNSQRAMRGGSRARRPAAKHSTMAAVTALMLPCCAALLSSMGRRHASDAHARSAR
jgi:hypothetical protein